MIYVICTLIFSFGVRLMEHSIIVNPKIVALCLTEVESLGYLLTTFGVTMLLCLMAI